MAIAPVRKSIRVRLEPAAAFDLFTRQLARWWPLAQHSCAGADAVDVEFEPRAGGTVFERTRAGERHVWGTLLDWEPPHRFAMTWHPGVEPAKATRLAVEFVAARDGGTEVNLVHDRWEARDESARRSYDGGWEGVLARFVAAAEEEG
jgi:uncharacterized protein YndB with AHSA1/START domain